MTYRAPGRVNLIGEHTDYNLGFVLPIALALETRITTEPSSEARNTDGTLHLHSEAKNETRTFLIADLATLKPSKHWSDYVIGVAQELQALGVTIPGLSLRIESTVPEGAGLSSSAALEVAAALAFLQGRELPPIEIAKLCQRAEINFVGMPCGIMDQYVSIFAREHAALKIDCRSLESEPVLLPDNVTILAVNSMVKHSLGDSAYRTRVAECAEACREMGVASLRDATMAQVGDRKRARHIVSENLRVEAFVEAARNSNLIRMGELFLESHRSMRDDYEISCDEIDFLVNTAAALAGCYGARMTGGGFGGCTVNLVAPEAAEEFAASISSAYKAAIGRDPQVIACIPAAGAGVLRENG